MQSPEIVLAALVVMLVGAAVLYYQYTGTRKFESVIAFCGVALVAGGFAMAQDGVLGTRKFLWMLPSASSSILAQPLGNSVVANSPPATVAISD
ncbi:hypothetical protein [Hyphomicrobium sp.]|uniref:hypothetical protein n=1 Tax=Hyphomicrobium sp. TaxID=82 RepID=UPI002E30E239|nr:hypothetical protein [Hyphomicrobium sp.]HEX2843248.1 hypothetical protein [Hyphomicrobium sp.]